MTDVILVHYKGNVIEFELFNYSLKFIFILNWLSFNSNCH